MTIEGKNAFLADELRRQVIELAKQAEYRISRNEFEQALSKLKELQKIA